MKHRAAANSLNQKENEKCVGNQYALKYRAPLQQELLMNLKNQQLRNLDAISQILQSKFCKVEKRDNVEYFKFDFKQQNICDRVKFLMNQPDDDTNKTEQFKAQYKVGSRIGQGAYASVRVAIQIETDTKVAIKIYEKTKIKDLQRRKGVRREIEILEKLDHPNIVKILDTVESNNHVNIILEYVSGSSLHHLVRKQPERRLEEDIAKGIFKQILDAIQYCHSKNIAHRDIKLENILLEGLTPKLIDFGFSTSFPIDKKVKMFCGTPSYMAPEIVTRQEYRGDKSDVWALGVVLFSMLQGVFPFKGDTDQELYTRIQSGEFIIIHDISKEAIALLYGMLTIDPDERPTVVELLNYPWFKKYQQNLETEELKKKHKLPDDLIEDLNTITKNMSYITPTSQIKQQFYFDFSHLKNNSKQNNTKAVIPKPNYFTTTNAQTKQREPQFFKVERILTKNERHTTTHSKERQPTLSKERQSSYSFESSRGLSQKKNPHQLTVHPSFIPSEKSFNSVKSPSMGMTEKRSFNFFYN
ncbi:unnamed protein product (macronuclear) [Paramecium tetraurelia]|uniref:Protein kinase domain-containing protein n=1 Tax=Paramecium tetraurelia TaxID=5888 RepID=A0C6L7_PARTE|nr:uncharacterized protein GSPATT00035563001 [Paramecium tetraurelia]CAK66434.1 unnamed protein product [Paramecium tetraurelia]|eukprot:XP_001433831.1 hypothetical protein (macronuclear) [Paramecium tetraurelia strain d4-2]